MVIGPYLNLIVRFPVIFLLAFSFVLLLSGNSCKPLNKYALRPLLVLVLSRTLSIGLNWIRSIALSKLFPCLLHLAFR